MPEERGVREYGVGGGPINTGSAALKLLRKYEHAFIVHNPHVTKHTHAQRSLSGPRNACCWAISRLLGHSALRLKLHICHTFCTSQCSIRCWPSTPLSTPCTPHTSHTCSTHDAGVDDGPAVTGVPHDVHVVRARVCGTCLAHHVLRLLAGTPCARRVQALGGLHAHGVRRVQVMVWCKLQAWVWLGWMTDRGV